MVRDEVWAFDDSINHEAWNDNAGDRIGLIFDVWYPGLTEQARREITSLLEPVSAQLGMIVQSLKRSVAQPNGAIFCSMGKVLCGLTPWSAVPILPRLSS
tara:strand:+ start:256 stop:555 length:300 start_codon:yes stop_codon:yes gene_type:complete